MAHFIIHYFENLKLHFNQIAIVLEPYSHILTAFNLNMKHTQNLNKCL